MRQVYERIVKWFYNLREKDPLRFNELFSSIVEKENDVMIINCGKHYITIVHYNKGTPGCSEKVMFSIDSVFEMNIDSIISLHHSLVMHKRFGWEIYLDLNFFRELERIGLCRIVVMEGGGIFCMLLLKDTNESKKGS